MTSPNFFGLQTGSRQIMWRNGLRTSWRKEMPFGVTLRQRRSEADRNKGLSLRSHQTSSGSFSVQGNLITEAYHPWVLERNWFYEYHLFTIYITRLLHSYTPSFGCSKASLLIMIGLVSFVYTTSLLNSRPHQCATINSVSTSNRFAFSICPCSQLFAHQAIWHPPHLKYLVNCSRK